ncbi:MAG: protein translocase subunit SecF [Armatimonadetes bacterium]|nr:protein translocase subunit SecF [Armatimonadota bacterium]
MHHLTGGDILGLILWLVALTAVTLWGQSCRRKHYDWMGKKPIFAAISGIILVVAIFSLSTRGLNYGLDFTGGTMLELAAYQQVDGQQVNEALETFEGAPIEDKLVQTGADQVQDEQGRPYQKVLIRATLEGGQELTSEQGQALLAHLQGQLGDIQLLRRANIGPTVSGELKGAALKALILALVLQLLYIFFRFGNQMRFGVAADVALIHDVVIMVGLYSLSGRQVDSPFVAAVLTVAGYSVMDSVVIFDRIRENLHLKRNLAFEQVVNESVNETMTRSINTTMTVVITLIAIYYFGGTTLQDFAFALLVGIVSGAYSSIFVASPVLAVIDKWAGSRPVAEAATAADPAPRVRETEEEAWEEEEEDEAGGGGSTALKRKRRRGSRKKKA